MMKNKKTGDEMNTRILGNIRSYTRKDYNNLFRVFRKQGKEEQLVRWNHFLSFAYPFSLTYYHTTDKLSENNLGLRTDYFLWGL